ncbi:BgTH12-01298 [Blumeria graminis f. sp. triticale]|uniref:Bgt-254 n=3 Tax=Blumeria graminis TaxID=34373 RepID=A0A9X9MNE5_BLUGR|nr:hypothetical protein BGT96224_254 [Blumeria graminis f. sp. tritici 96224]CAD6505811.1 BgTH12-01298 [Blumeria graminis f. sp. triticale]VDB93982.1 Bgt-254 [Blumeria graminis f. sp. tritici]
MNNRDVHVDQDFIDKLLEAFCNVDNLKSTYYNSQKASVPLKQCDKHILYLLLQQSYRIKSQACESDKPLDCTVIERLDDIIALSREKFYAYPYKDVPAHWRLVYWEASLLKVAALVLGELGANVPHILSPSCIDSIVNTIDMAIIMAGNQLPVHIQKGIDMVMESFSTIDRPSVISRTTSRDKRQRIDVTRDWSDHFPENTKQLPQITHPDLGAEPLIISGSLEHWPARNSRPWSSPSYLMAQTIGGRRLVPIELGRSYVDEGWGQKIIPFKQFLDTFIIRDSKTDEVSTGYLAQHDLFSQIPNLRHDIAIPDYCFASVPSPHKSCPLLNKYLETPKLNEPLLNAWFGPAGTITPLHTDPYHNILAQVVGKKYVRLYAPRESSNIYARGFEMGGIDMGNTSIVDVGKFIGLDGTTSEQEEARKDFPLFENAQFVDCILEEGDCLYIPVGWWHYVRSLSISFSVSFWFN